jgi:hypothetical protein
MKSAVEAGDQASRADSQTPPNWRTTLASVPSIAKEPNSHAARNNGRVQATSGAVASGVGRS